MGVTIDGLSKLSPPFEGSIGLLGGLFKHDTSSDSCFLIDLDHNVSISHAIAIMKDHYSNQECSELMGFN